MKAARFYTAGDIRVEQAAAPEAGPVADQVLVRTSECGICGTDLHEYRHGPIHTLADPHPRSGAHIPQILGHEFAGEVVAAGPDVRGVAVGDRVAIMPQVYCGRCAQCLAGRQQCCLNLTAVGYSWPWGGFAEYALLHEPQVSPLPDEMSDAAGALVEPAAVGVHAVASAPVRPGDTVLVSGGGPIGQLTALAAVAAGAGAVFLAEPNDGRRTLAAGLGLSDVIDPRAESVAERLTAETDGLGADVAMECSGSRPGLEGCLAAVKSGGTVVQTALFPGPVELDVSGALTMRDVTLRGVYCYPVTSWPRVIRMIASGRLPVERIVTGRIGLDDIVPRGFEALIDPGGTHVKVLVRM